MKDLETQRNQTANWTLSSTDNWQKMEDVKSDKLSWKFHLLLWLFVYFFIVYWFAFIFLCLKDIKRSKEIKRNVLLWAPGTNTDILFLPAANFAEEGETWGSSRAFFVVWNWATDISGASSYLVLPQLKFMARRPKLRPLQKTTNSSG